MYRFNRHGVADPTMTHDLTPPQPHEPYGRTVLQALGSGHELVAMRWRQGAVCAPHDHGAARGAIHLIAGRFVERRYTAGPDGLTLIQTLVHTAPAVIEVAPATIHDMQSLDHGLSLHHYEPAIEDMRVWDIAGRQTLVVSNDCGAWIPDDETLIIERSPWSAPWE